MVRIYAVSCDIQRQERLLKVAEPLHLDIEFIKSPLKDDPEVLRRGKKELEERGGYATGIAATLGHIYAMEKFIKDGEDVGIIIEDDVRFHKDFNEILYKLVSSNWKESFNVISLGYCSFPHGQIKNINDVDVIADAGVSNPWGAQCYMITRDFAIHFTALFKNHDDVTEVSLTHFVTDWIIFDPRLGCKRCALPKPIAIEGLDELSIAGNNNKPDMRNFVDISMFYI